MQRDVYSEIFTPEDFKLLGRSKNTGMSLTHLHRRSLLVASFKTVFTTVVRNTGKDIPK